MPYAIRQLDASTWDTFAELVERNNGVYGGCWCIGYHPECAEKGINYRDAKEDRVRTGRAHAALVIDENGAAQGWCQYGSPEELPGIKHSVSTTRTLHPGRIGGSPASSSTRGIAVEASPGRAWRGRSTRSPVSAAASSRPSPR